MPLCILLSTASSVPRVRLRLVSREAMPSRLASCMGEPRAHRVAGDAACCCPSMLVASPPWLPDSNHEIVYCHPMVELSRKGYEKGVALSKAAMRAVEARLERNPLLPKWDILIQPAGAD